MTTGASFGAYHALTFALRYPHLVNRAIGMSGVYDIREVIDGYTDQHVYPFNPAEFILGEHDHGRLETMRRMDIILAVLAADRKNDGHALHGVQGSMNHVAQDELLRPGWAHDRVL